jgi:hypothetical protein
MNQELQLATNEHGYTQMSNVLKTECFIRDNPCSSVANNLFLQA